MKFALAILLAAASLRAQVVVQAGKQAQIQAPGATTAVTLDPKVAEAAVTNGVLTIVGVEAGDTRIIAVSQDALQEVKVHVLPRPPQYPAGFIPPPPAVHDGGSYEFRFSSDRTQFENALDLYTQGPNQTKQLHFVSATFAGGPAPTSYVPSAYYRVATQTTDATFLDQTVNDSALTVQNVVLRGLHIQDGAWQFHGGYTASADFENVFLPVEKEFAAGAGYTQSLGNVLKVTPQLYFLRSIDLADGRQRSAMIGSMLFNIHFYPGWELKSEVAYGRGVALAGELQHSGATSKLKARISKKDLEFPSLRSNSLPGLSGDLSWTQTFTRRLELLSGATINNVELETIRQDSRSAYSSLRYKLSQSWSVGTGVNYGSFSSIGSYSATTLALPQQINFDRAHFGAGFQYQFSTASDSFSTGNGFRQTLRLNFGRFQIGEFLDWQNDALSISSLYSQLPGLQQELQRLGITAVTPDQLATLLQDTAFLQTLGLSTQAQIVTVPHRLQEGGNLTWSSSGNRPHQLSFSIVESHNEFSTSTSSDYSFTGSYAKELDASNQLQLSWSVMQSSLSGQQQVVPLVSVSLRHRLSHAPGILAAPRSMSISGTAFVDAKRQGHYEPEMEPVSRAAVTLDGEKTVFTDSLGHFRFTGVTAGDHTIQLHYNSARPHYFTTPQETVTAGGSIVNFGIAFSTIELWGYVRDDADNGMENVRLQITGAFGKTIISTDRSGKFSLADVQPGGYQVEVDPATIAVGYSTADLAPVPVSVSVSSASHPILKVPAMRNLTGTVTVYNPALGNYVPVKGARVSIPELGKTVITSDSGKFVIGGLPPGELVVEVAAGHSSLAQTVTVPIQPVTLKEDFRISSVNGEIAFTLARTPN